jgi:hypothetical protein
VKEKDVSKEKLVRKKNLIDIYRIGVRYYGVAKLRRRSSIANICNLLFTFFQIFSHHLVLQAFFFHKLKHDSIRLFSRQGELFFQID